MYAAVTVSKFPLPRQTDMHTLLLWVKPNSEPVMPDQMQSIVCDVFICAVALYFGNNSK